MPTTCDLNAIIIGVTITITSTIIIWGVTTFYNTKDRNKIYNWLKNNTKKDRGNYYKSTYDIAKWNDFTEDKVHELCSKDKRIFSSSKEKNTWNIYKRENIPPKYYFG